MVAVPSTYRILIAGLIIVPILIQVYSRNSLSLFSLSEFLLLIFATLCIGIAEEFLSRGIVFSLFEKSGIWKAVVISSFSFGVMHYMGYQQGENFGKATWRVVDASAMGVVFVGLMLFTKSIWYSVIFHSLNNLPILQNGVYPSTLSNPIDSNYLKTIFLSIILKLFFGTFLIHYAFNSPVILNRLLLKFKLVE
jgi:membrane protease YdiL (CAAX protease family)